MSSFRIEEDEVADSKNSIKYKDFNLNVFNETKENKLDKKFSNILKSDDNGKIISKEKYDIVIEKIKHLEDKLSYLDNQINEKKNENSNLKNELLKLEKENNLIQNKDVNSILLKKDELRSSINTLTKDIIEQNKEIRNNKVLFKVLNKDNEKLNNELKELEKNEDYYDKKIEEYNKNLEEYEHLKLCLEEKDYIKSEQIYFTKMKLEDNAKIQMEFELNRIKKEIESNEDLAIFYLEKYIEILKNKK